MKIILVLIVISLFSFSTLAYAYESVPLWVKNNAGWWAQGKITDSDFLNGIQFLVESKIIQTSKKSANNGNSAIPKWVKNNAGWWAQGKITENDFLYGIEALIQMGLINIKPDSDGKTVDLNLDYNPGGSRVEVLDSSMFNVYSYEEDWNEQQKQYNFVWVEKKPGFDYSKFYADRGTIMIIPVFTNAAYWSPGFYDYYFGECDESCLTTDLKLDRPLLPDASRNAVNVLLLLEYEYITDVEVSKNPDILNDYEKVILLHNEYVTVEEFRAITEHPKVVYLYPNALYAKVTYDQSDNTISLIRGHGYPEKDISNGFDWEHDNTHPYEYRKCKDWEFYEISNGIMLNCFPEISILDNPELLKAIKDY